jgi:carboxymethylenebutenolidase
MKLKFFVFFVLLLSVAALPLVASAQEDDALEVESGDVEVTSGEQVYPSYLSAPTSGGPYPGIVLIHSFNGLEEGYKTMVDQLAAEGFVVLALGWQSIEREPADATVQQLVEDGAAFLSAREDVDPARLGLTGFCAGGRYTMLLLPQSESFAAGVAWYGFPTRGEPAPNTLIGDLSAPMLIIHGTADEPSPIADIYQYATDLAAASAEFELKVYSGEPHGFMLADGQLRDDEVAQDAFDQMADFFSRKLGGEADS